ncbi:MAG: glycerate kinase [Clostridium sp.]|nr:glycerate kinase [Clostridium sp.]
MNVVVAIDSLKGSLSSLEAGAAIREGIHKVMPNAQVVVRPVADGGEGTVEALTLGMYGHMEKVVVSDPLGRPVEAVYGILDNTKTAVIEIAAAAGIVLISEEEKNPMDTTTYGVGQMIRDAVYKGCRKFIVGIGGSVTNDGGAGMLQALGYGFWNREGLPIKLGAKGLQELASITDDNVIPELSECSFKIACDVTNPLCGEYGASAVYGPQKGATPGMILQMDKWLEDYAVLAAKSFPKADRMQPGTGAAGGLGFAFLSFMNTKLESGIKMILEETELESYIEGADLVITGEGRLDGQTAMGKAPSGVAALAKKYGKKVLAFSGCVTEDAGICNEHGIDAFFPILRGVVTLDEACNPENARKNMTAAVEQVFRLIRCYL